MKLLFKRAGILSLMILAISFLGCEDDDEANGLPEVVAAFTQTQIEDSGVVSFINISENADSFEWDFGDGTTSTEIDPIKTFVSGTFTVTLTASNSAGASDTFEDEITISIPEPPTPLTLPIDFDGTDEDYDIIVGDNIGFTVETNPENGNGNDTNVGQMVAGGGQFQNVQFPLGPAVDFSSANKTIQLELFASAEIAVLVKFEDGADGARDVEVGATHTGSGWETLTFDFATDAVASFIEGDSQNGQAIVPDGQFGKMILFIGFNTDPGVEGTFYVDNIEQVATAPPAGCTDTSLELPIDFDCESTTYDFVTFNGASYQVIDNPELSGVNAVASKVGEIVNAGGAFEGGAFTLDTPVDFSTDKSITMKVYSTVALPVLLKFEGAVPPIETPVNHGGTGWEQLTFDFTSSDQFDTLVLFIDGPGTTAGTFYVDDIEQVATAPPAGCTDTSLELPIDFDCESTTYDFVTFNGASYQVIDNPELSGVNAVASKVGEIVNAGGAFEGGAFTLDTPVDFSTDKSITMKVYSTVALPVLLKFEGAVPPIETPVNHGGTGWEQLTFDFTSSDQFDTLVLFIDGPGTTAGTFYVDDIEQVATSGGGSGGGCTATPTDALSLPATFEACESFLGTFTNDGSITTELAANPSATGLNTSANVLRINKAIGTSRFAGVQNAFPNTDVIGDLATTTLKVLVYSDRANVSYRFGVNNNPNAPGVGLPAEVTVVAAAANEWVELEVVFTGIPPNFEANQLVIKPDNPTSIGDTELTTEDGVFFIDNIRID